MEAGMGRIETNPDNDEDELTEADLRNAEAADEDAKKRYESATGQQRE